MDNHEEDNSTLIAGFATLALGNQILHPEATINGNSIPDDVPNSISHNHIMRPFIDPGLVIKRRHHLNETWFSDFVSPTSAPRGAYSPLSQALKKVLPERAACRLGN
jgi:hypothetical protein